MATTPISTLIFPTNKSGFGCFECGERQTNLPFPLPEIGDDFDWRARDYDGFRQFMLEELAARFPERQRWTAADLEVVLVEILANSLDGLSDMADRVFAEGYLQSAKRPDSLRRLLAIIGYDAVAEADAHGHIDIDDQTDTSLANEMLERFWAQNPYEMENARAAGPRAVRTQHRMVSIEDYAAKLTEHPAIAAAKAEFKWTGSWYTLFLAVILSEDVIRFNEKLLDDTIDLPDTLNAEADKHMLDIQNAITRFNEQRRIPVPNWDPLNPPSFRAILTPYIDRYRLVGQDVILMDAVEVGITIGAVLNVQPNYFSSEVLKEAKSRLSNGPGGFFEPGRMRFGDDLYASDIIAILMQITGVETVCLTSFKRTGSRFPDQTLSGRIKLSGLETAICDNDKAALQRGYIRLKTQGGNGT